MIEPVSARRARIWHKPEAQIFAICITYLLFSILFATVKLDGDEFHVVKEPFELLGGDYSAAYVREGAYGQAFETAWKSYGLYWRYRPLFSPVIAEEHKVLFSDEERRFGYVKPESVTASDPDALSKYQNRLIVPEPDRFYKHGAGKPLLPAVLTIPQLVLIAWVSSGDELLVIQHTFERHALFILTRLVQIVAGLASILIVSFILRKEFGPMIAPVGAAVFAFVPITPMYFADIHADSIMIPFLIGSMYLLFKGDVIRGGILFGLALASKNTAIFLLPAFSLFYLIEGWMIYRTSFLELLGYLMLKARRVVLFTLIGIVALTPFANPISYVSEILTPITHREFDPRGEDVSKWTIGGDASSESVTGVRLRSALTIDDMFFLYLLVGFFVAMQLNLRPISRLSLIMLLLVVPYGIIFGYAMNWRYLMFLPFFSIFCVEVLSRRNLGVLAGVLLSLTVTHALDVISIPIGEPLDAIARTIRQDG
jgi:hypothetical protein